MPRRCVFSDRSSGRYITYHTSPRSRNQYTERPERNLGRLLGPPQRRDFRGYQENIERPRGVLSSVARRAGVARLSLDLDAAQVREDALVPRIQGK